MQIKMAKPIWVWCNIYKKVHFQKNCSLQVLIRLSLTQIGDTFYLTTFWRKCIVYCSIQIKLLQQIIWYNIHGAFQTETNPNWKHLCKPTFSSLNVCCVYGCILPLIRWIIQLCFLDWWIWNLLPSATIKKKKMLAQ